MCGPGPWNESQVLVTLTPKASFLATSNPTSPPLSSQNTISYFSGACIDGAPTVCLAQHELPTTGACVTCTAQCQVMAPSLTSTCPGPGRFLEAGLPQAQRRRPRGLKLRRCPVNGL